LLCIAQFALVFGFHFGAHGCSGAVQCFGFHEVLYGGVGAQFVAQLCIFAHQIFVEVLQDITEKGAKAEGIIYNGDGTYKNYFTQKGLREQDGVDCILPKGSFQSLWCSINGPESWDANPWVWVVKFKVLSTTGKPRTLGYQPDTGEYHFANKIIKP